MRCIVALRLTHRLASAEHLQVKRRVRDCKGLVVSEEIVGSKGGRSYRIAIHVQHISHTERVIYAS